MLEAVKEQKIKNKNRIFPKSCGTTLKPQENTGYVKNLNLIAEEEYEEYVENILKINKNQKDAEITKKKKEMSNEDVLSAFQQENYEILAKSKIFLKNLQVLIQKMKFKLEKFGYFY